MYHFKAETLTTKDKNREFPVEISDFYLLKQKQPYRIPYSYFWE